MLQNTGKYIYFVKNFKFDEPDFASHLMRCAQLLNKLLKTQDSSAVQQCKQTNKTSPEKEQT